MPVKLDRAQLLKPGFGRNGKVIRQAHLVGHFPKLHQGEGLVQVNVLIAAGRGVVLLLLQVEQVGLFSLRQHLGHQGEFHGVREGLGHGLPAQVIGGQVG